MASKKTTALKGNGKSTASSSALTETKKQTEMKPSEIRYLIDFIAQSGLNEVDIETKELKLHVKREPDQKVMKASAPVLAAAPVAIAAAPAPVILPAKTEKPVVASQTTVEIKSPMIGTFYRSSNPDTPPFVSVGDKVTKGQIVGMIEAMKLFNEIECEVKGKIVKVLVDDASPVEYDQPLFLVDPS